MLLLLLLLLSLIIFNTNLIYGQIYSYIPAPAGCPIETSPGGIGWFGQDCTASQGDCPQGCPIIGQDLISNSGKIECIHNFDCCTCGKMQCGTRLSPDCTDLICNGDSGCFGVRDIILYGSISGVSINCNGDLSCMRTGIIGYDVSSILCSGDGSCSNSVFNLQCLLPNGCKLECVGDNSCESDPIIQQLKSIYTITNSYGLVCAAAACKYSTFLFETNIGGSIICGAYDSCLNSKITINNIDGIMCGGRNSCKNANILIINPQNTFSLSCQSAFSCYNLNIEIVITDPLIKEFRSISCGAISSCEGMKITITKLIPSTMIIPIDGSRNLLISELICGGMTACKNTIFELSDNISFEQCGCAGGSTRSCQGLIGVDSCSQGLLSFECTGNSCQNMKEEIVNPMNGFELICNDPNSCKNFELTIRITSSSNAPTRLGGIRCDQIDSCNGLKVYIINMVTGTARKQVSSGIITCSSTNSCAGAMFVTWYADIDRIDCSVPNSCTQCQKWTNLVYSQCSNSPLSQIQSQSQSPVV